YSYTKHAASWSSGIPEKSHSFRKSGLDFLPEKICGGFVTSVAPALGGCVDEVPRLTEKKDSLCVGDDRLRRVRRDIAMRLRLQTERPSCQSQRAQSSNISQPASASQVADNVGRLLPVNYPFRAPVLPRR